MRTFIIKRKEAATLKNLFFNTEISFSDNTTIYAGLLFLRKKEEKKYLSTLKCKNFYEVIGVTINK